MSNQPPFQRIIHPTDFSDCAAEAQRYAVALARTERASLVLLHAWRRSLYPGTEMMIVQTPDATPMPLIRYLEVSASRQLDALVARLRAELVGLSIEGVLVDGAPEEELFALATQGDAVVMGTHGRGRLAHLFLGSVTERTLRRATVPVLTVRPGEARAMPPRRMLVPIDFSEPSRAAVALATRLAIVAGGAAIDVLHVWEQPEGPPGDAVVVHLPTGERPSLSEYLRASAQREMHEFLAGLERFGTIELRREVSSGRPADVIIEASAAYDAVVVGTHGRHGVPHVVLGSVAEKVVRRSACPVWTVRG